MNPEDKDVPTAPTPQAQQYRAEAEELQKRAMRILLRSTMQSKKAKEILRRNNIAGSIIGGRQG